MDDRATLDAVVGVALSARDPEPIEDAIPLLPCFLREHPAEEMAHVRHRRLCLATEGRSVVAGARCAF